MCISDYRIGRLTRTQLDTVSVAAGTPITIPPNPQRVGIMLVTATPIIVVTTFCLVTVGGVVVGKLWGTAPIVDLRMQRDGDLCTKEFVLTATSATHVVGVTQFILSEAEINTALAEFKRSY